MKAVFLLEDTESGCVVEVTVSQERGHLAIGVSGYGEYEAEDGDGTPILLEYYNGSLRMVTFPNINSEEAVIVDMEGAAEDKRQWLCPNCGDRKVRAEWMLCTTPLAGPVKLNHDGFRGVAKSNEYYFDTDNKKVVFSHMPEENNVDDTNFVCNECDHPVEGKNGTKIMDTKQLYTLMMGSD